MSQILNFDVAPAVTIAALLAFIALLTVRICSRHRRRKAQLETAAELLSEHLTALKAFVEHPQGPQQLREKLLIFSAVVSERASFLRVLESVCNNAGKNRNSSEAKTYEKQVAQLRAQNEELSRCFETAVSTIVVAMMLRHQDAGELIESWMAKMIVDPRREFAFLAGAIRADRADGGGPNGNWSNGFGAQAAIA
jgi:hypothetical protein